MKRLLPLFLMLTYGNLIAQEFEDLTWYKIETMDLSGKIKTEGTTKNPFQRFPDSMKTFVRERVWDLSENPAGVYVDFETNAAEIIVRYQVNGPLEFPHMPATGVSGIDLYTFSKNSWKWVKGKYNFGDTISYTFRLKEVNDGIQNQLRLYLPLYNTVSSIEIGMGTDADFIKSPKENKVPIVVYGTSITQGACAGRPGMAWTSILSREIDIPVLNYGFSGNGHLEKEIITYLSQIKARAFIFDCLANFARPGLNAEEAKKRLIESVKKLRKSRPETPIILADHAGYPHGEVYPPSKKIYLNLNKANREAFTILKENNIEHIFLLENKELGLKQDDFIDGVHPNDAGMKKYANAYFDLLNEILK